MTKRLIFVNSPSPFLLSDRGAPALGSLYLAAEVRASGAAEVAYVDLTGNALAAGQLGCEASTFLNNGLYWVPELMPMIDRSRDIIALSVTSAQYGSARNLLLCLKWEFGSDLQVIIGGPHASALPQECLQDGFDTVFVGEADHVLPRWIREGCPPGVLHASAPQDLDVLPLPARDLVDLSSYCSNLTVGEGFSSTLMMSRGCPYSCRYCVRTLGDAARQLRVRSVTNILDELHELECTYGLKRFVAVDDLWGIKRVWVEDFCRVFAKESYHFRVNMRANVLHHDLLPAMKRAGIDCISFGFESGDQRILDAISKNTVELNTKAVELCHDHGINVKSYLIFGFEGDDRQSMEATMRWIEAAHPDSAQIATLVPLPGTPIYSNAINRGWVPHYEQLYHNGSQGKGGDQMLPWWTDETLVLRDELLAWIEAYYARPQGPVTCPNALSER